MDGCVLYTNTVVSLVYANLLCARANSASYSQLPSLARQLSVTSLNPASSAVFIYLCPALTFTRCLSFSSAAVYCTRLLYIVSQKTVRIAFGITLSNFHKLWQLLA